MQFINWDIKSSARKKITEKENDNFLFFYSMPLPATVAEYHTLSLGDFFSVFTTSHFSRAIINIYRREMKNRIIRSERKNESTATRTSYNFPSMKILLRQMCREKKNACTVQMPKRNRILYVSMKIERYKHITHSHLLQI